VCLLLFTTHVFCVICRFAGGAKFRSTSAAAALAVKRAVVVKDGEQEQAKSRPLRSSSRRRSRSVGSLLYYSQHDVIADEISPGHYCL